MEKIIQQATVAVSFPKNNKIEDKMYLNTRKANRHTQTLLLKRLQMKSYMQDWFIKMLGGDSQKIVLIYMIQYTLSGYDAQRKIMYAFFERLSTLDSKVLGHRISS